MIVFELICAESHRFEGWFASIEDFGNQQDRRLLACPVCGSTLVTKLLMAKIGRAQAEEDPRTRREILPKQPIQPGLTELIDHILLNTEDVGSGFASEARRMHAGEAPDRAIRGQASAEESLALQAEGIPVFALPIPPKAGWH